MSFIIANIGTIVVGFIVFSLVGLIVRKMIKDKKNHISSCGCGGDCSNCPSCGHR